MGKLVLKTVAITLAAILGVCMIIFGTLAMVAPAKIASFFDKIGWYNSSVRYYEKQYGESENIEDLAVLILKIDDERDSAKEKKYLEILLNRSDYKSYCTTKDNENESLEIKTNEYYSGAYALALVRVGRFNDAVNFAYDFVRNNTYTAYNPFSTIIAELGETLSLEQLEKIKTKVLGFSFKGHAKADLREINRLISEKSE